LYDIAVVKDDAHSPIVTNSWKHIFLYRAFKAVGIASDVKSFVSVLSNFDPNAYMKNEVFAYYFNQFRTFVVNKKNNVAYRQAGKNCTFGSVYGMGPDTAAATYNMTTNELHKAGIDETVNVTKDEAEVALWAIRQFIPKTFKYIDTMVEQAFANGYLVLNKRSNSRVWFTDVIQILACCKSTIDEFAEQGETVAIKNIFNGTYTLTSNDSYKIDWKVVHDIDGQARNLPISGTQADMLKEAMVTLHKLIHRYGIRMKLLLSVHDELVVEIPENYADIKLPHFVDKELQIKWEGDKFEDFVPYIMTTVANKYLTNVTMKASSDILPYWNK
jgi:DNA polymerase I-like protein with 3'-5' exonuclease and polymerase domains